MSDDDVFFAALSEARQRSHLAVWRVVRRLERAAKRSRLGEGEATRLRAYRQALRERQ